MMYRVESTRLVWPAGTTLTVEELEGCNIEAWLIGGHLTLVTETQAAPDVPQKMSKRTPVQPEPDDTADQPEEQE